MPALIASLLIAAAPPSLGRPSTEPSTLPASTLARLLPFGSGQFQNGDDDLGTGLALSQAAMLATNVGSYVWASRLDASSPGGRRAARGLVATQYASLVVFGLLWSLGAIESLNAAPSRRLSGAALPSMRSSTPEQRQVILNAAGAWFDVYVDDEPTPRLNGVFGRSVLMLSHGSHRLRFVNDLAQSQAINLDVGPSSPPGPLAIRLLPKPARLVLRGAPDGATVVVNGVRTLIDPWTRDEPILVPLALALAPGAGWRTYDILVRDQSGNTILTRRVIFRPGETVILQCTESPSNP